MCSHMPQVKCAADVPTTSAKTGKYSHAVLLVHCAPTCMTTHNCKKVRGNEVLSTAAGEVCYM